MNEFIARHAERMTGVLSGFDRLVIRGTLRPISYSEGMMGYVSGNSVRPTGFGRHVLQVSERLKQACKGKTEALGVETCRTFDVYGTGRSGSWSWYRASGSACSCISTGYIGSLDF